MSGGDEPRWRRYLRFYGRDVKADLEDELGFHLTERIEMYERAGMSPDEARREARAKMGELTSVRRDCARQGESAQSIRRRRERTLTWSQDLRYGWRSLRNQPGFSIVATLTLGLGVGVTAGIFGVADSVLFQPLLYPTEDRVAVVWELSPGEGSRWTAAPGKIADWRAQAESFAAFAVVDPSSVTITGQGDPERISATRASAEVERVFGVSPILGRWLSEAEVESGEHVVVLGHDLWLRRYGGTDKVLGSGVFLDGERYTVIGVMPAGFEPLNPSELWLPHGPLPNARGAHYLRVAGLLAAGSDFADAQTEMNVIADRLASAYPDTDAGYGIELLPLREEMLGDARTPILIWLGAVGLVLLIGAANLTNLLLARASSRMPEMALRRSLGASRARIIRQLLTENLLLAVFAGAVAIGLAVLVQSVLLAIQPGILPRTPEGGIGLRLVGVALGLAVAGSVVAGLVPSLRLSRQSEAGLVGGVGGRASGLFRRDRVMTGLIVGEIGLAVMLTVGAGLLIQTLRELQEMDMGFASANRIAFRVSLPESRYPSNDEQRAFYEDLRTSLGAIPGVVAVGGANGAPLDGVPWFQTTSTVTDGNGDPISMPAPFRVVTRGYFEAAGIALVSGRVFDERDRVGSVRTVVLEKRLADALFPGLDPLGRQLRISYADALSVEVIGVVRDVRQYGPQSTPTPGLYVPVRQVGWSALTMVLHVDQPLAAIAPAIRSTVWRIDSDLPLYQLNTVEARVADSLGDNRFQTTLLSSFAVLALLLGIVGVYGVLSYAVGRRTREIGIRVALGAGPGQVVGSVVRWGGRLGALGISIGIAGALAMSRVLENQIFGVELRPGIYVLVAAGTAVAVLAATWLPARRAAGVDPVIALRQE